MKPCSAGLPLVRAADNFASSNKKKSPDKLMKQLTSFTLAALVVAAGSAFGADITGTVTLKGTPPPEAANNQIMGNAVCGKAYKEAPKTQHYVVGANGELANVIVMLKGVPAKAADATAKPVVVDQKNCLYYPQIFAAQTGQKILIKNSDPEIHNISSVRENAVAANGTINKTQMPGAPDVEISFPAAENFMRLRCDVHQWMFAWVTVVDHPYFALTDKSGKFTIKDVPAGKYKIVAMHRKASPAGVEKEADVTAGNAAVDFTIDAPAAK
jgi:plastocyanin